MRPPTRCSSACPARRSRRSRSPRRSRGPFSGSSWNRTRPGRRRRSREDCRMWILECRRVAALVFAGTACATGTQRTSEPPAAVTPSSAVVSRPRPYPVFETREFARAVELGTRTRTGRPGLNYWQQYSTYRLEATYDPATKRLTGRGTMRYANRSPDTLGNVFLHLYANLFAPDAMRNEPVPVTGGVELRRVAIDGRALGEAPNDTAPGYEVFSTILRVRPLARILPGATVQLDIEWQYTVPPDGAPRGGDDGEIAYIAYWYPQFAV